MWEYVSLGLYLLGAISTFYTFSVADLFGDTLKAKLENLAFAIFWPIWIIGVLILESIIWIKNKW